MMRRGGAQRDLMKSKETAPRLTSYINFALTNKPGGLNAPMKTRVRHLALSVCAPLLRGRALCAPCYVFTADRGRQGEAWESQRLSGNDTAIFGELISIKEMRTA